MKIITWNINSLRLRVKLLNKVILDYQPDIICLQETKVINDLFPVEQFSKQGYYVYYSGQKSYNGVAILSKILADSTFRLNFCNDDARHLAIKLKNLEIHNFYVPAGGDIPCVVENLKFKHKLDYLAAMKNWFMQERDTKDKIILAGDLNIAPYEHDVWSSKQLTNVVSHTDVEKKALDELKKSLNFIDSCRQLVPKQEKFYTWWSYRNIDWQKSNRGRRLDHIWVTPNLTQDICNVRSVTNARAWEAPSDHVPYILEMK